MCIRDRVERRAALGVTENLVRLSVGVEDVADLRCDLEFALGSGSEKVGE